MVGVVWGMTVTTSAYSLNLMVGSGGDTNTNLSGLNVSYGITQYTIGNYTDPNYTKELGIFYIALSGSTGIFIPPTPLLPFLISIKERGMEHIWINWTG